MEPDVPAPRSRSARCVGRPSGGIREPRTRSHRRQSWSRDSRATRHPSYSRQWRLGNVRGARGRDRPAGGRSHAGRGRSRFHLVGPGVAQIFDRTATAREGNPVRRGRSACVRSRGRRNRRFEPRWSRHAANFARPSSSRRLQGCQSSMTAESAMAWTPSKRSP